MNELPFTIATKRIEYLGNTANKKSEGPLQELETTPAINQRTQMEKHSILMDKKNQYHENGHTAQSNL